MKTRIIFLLLILTGLVFAQSEKGISIKSKAGNEGKRWAVCVGINNYDYNGILDLKKAQNDAVALTAFFAAAAGAAALLTSVLFALP
ncbi:MAG: hypothetical protein KKD38_05915 [Candidatus Delongbacteria bacterium]|nr:hypothetical protein [Candidatus Delongbacteria bacterium]MCG2759798.1 hypothetical protein [Candidatus Delongbacteria bacterium]